MPFAGKKIQGSLSSRYTDSAHQNMGRGFCTCNRGFAMDAMLLKKEDRPELETGLPASGDTGLLILDVTGQYRYHTPAFAALWGLDDGGPEIIARCAERVQNPEQWQACLALEGGTLDVRCRDGRLMRWEAIGGAVSGGERIFMCRVLEEGAAQKELDLLMRLRASWQLAAGLNHDVRNMLHAVSMALDFFSHSYEIEEALGPAAVKTLAHMRGTCDEIVRVMELLRAVSKGNRTEARLVEVDAAAGRAVGAVELYLRHDTRYKGVSVQVDRQLEDGGRVWVEEPLLFNILLNLLINAVEAMPAGGRVRISTRAGAGDVTVEVRDEGEGMDEETRCRVFEPFFSRKGEEGAGLGLALVQRTVERWGGSVAVFSVPGSGSSFAVTLPSAAEPDKEGRDGGEE